MRWIVAIVLLFSVTPAVPEFVENVVHVVAHGDLAHVGHEAPASDGGDEHGCTPLFHACGCHAAMSAATTLQRAPERVGAPPVTLAQRFEPESDGRRCEPPPLRPPIG